MTKFEEELMATAKMIPTSDGNEIKFKTSSALYDYLLLSNGEAELYLESQLQQQALPVVPECVGKMVEYAKKTKKSIRWFFTEDAYMFPEAMDWYAGSDKGLVDDTYAERQSSLINAFITGKYQVEKPQLFYLREKNTNYYLNKSKNNGLELVPNPYFDEDNQFTKQEIDSMETGSYEQIEVAE